jgi:hypothetical protein
VTACAVNAVRVRGVARGDQGVREEVTAFSGGLAGGQRGILIPRSPVTSVIGALRVAHTLSGFSHPIPDSVGWILAVVATVGNLLACGVSL